MLFVKYLHTIEVWLVGGKPAKFKKEYGSRRIQKKVIFKTRHGYLQATISRLQSRFLPTAQRQSKQYPLEWIYVLVLCDFPVDFCAGRVCTG